MGLLSVRGLDQTGEPFRRALADTAVALGIDANHLAAVISFETGGTFRANIQNPRSGATGLIQFMPATAKWLGTSTDELKRMTPTQQLPWVAKYFRAVAGTRQLSTVSDVYAAVFAPKFIGRPDNTVMYASPSAAYTQNRELDSNGDGTITKGEAAAHVRRILAAASERGDLVPQEDTALPFLLGIQVIRLAMKL